MADLEVPVLIVGGGGAGLTASMLLSNLGVDSLLVSALPTTSILPKAHVLNQRTMEILADAGVADEIYAQGTPRANMSHTGFYAGFAGWPDAGALMEKLEAWGGGGSDLDWEAASPRASTNLPQIRLEPIMRRRAEELAPGMVRFGHELVSFDQDDDGVTSTVLDRESGSEFTVRSDYLFACDAGRMVGPRLGVEMVGIRDVGSVASIHMTADLSKWAPDPEVLIRWIWVPHMATLATLVPMGPTRWGPRSEEWVLHLTYAVEDPRALDDATVEADMRQALGIGDHPVTIHLMTRWELMGVVASELRVGRTFLLGDAAHRHPPTGGLGLTSATQDVHNLCWKIAAVLNGVASEGLLDSYEPERRSSVQWNVDNSVESALNHMVIGEALGLTDPDLTPDEGWARVSRLWSGKPEDEAFRQRVRTSIASQTMEFRKLNVEYGYTYDSAAVVPDGTPSEPSPDPVRIYRPSTRPGSPLPHAWLDAIDGGRRSTIDLVRPGRFLVIAGEHGGPWIEAASALGGETALPVDAVRIGHVDGDYLDLRCRWLTVRGIDPEGAILVRPDRFVAWRHLGRATDPREELRRAFERILCREVPA
ncbi:MAG: FAD-dependent monooxygenase [Acidimicrobiales bacterium]